MSTDRPDVTESPFTLEKGRMQIEASFAEYSRERRSPEGSDTTEETWSVAPFNLRVALTNDTEAQFIYEPLVRISTRSGGARERQTGLGDLTLRVKRNLIGNDGGAYAVGVMPFVTLPTSTHDVGVSKTVGGLILPFAFTLPHGWEMGAMTELDFVEGESSGYRSEWLNTITFGHELTKDVGVYLELTSTTARGPHAMTFDFGFTYAASEDLQFDIGCNVGLTRAADDLTLFTGFSRRW